MEKIIGIDLGTTNSVVAIMENGRPKIIKDKSNRETPTSLVPSVVAINATGELVVGEAAKNYYLVSPENAVRSIKRKMGTSEKVKMGSKEYTPSEISAMILRYLKKLAENYLGETVQKAVITVPAYFSDAQRQATKDAGEIAGLEVVRIINEPTAAALAYGVDREEENQHLLVYDLGGGTFDVSVIEKVGSVLEVRASHGNNHLGGDDFDERLQDYIIKRIQEENPKINLREDIKAMARLRTMAEEAKIELSSRPFSRLTTPHLTKKGLFSTLNVDMEISRDEFIGLVKELLDSTVDSIDLALKDAELTADQIDKVLLVGGSTRIPYVWELAQKRMGKAPRADVHPDEAVALGAAVQAGIIAGEKINTVLVDVSPYSLGVEYAMIKAGRVIPGFYKRIIKRNTTIPTSASEVFYTMRPDQDLVDIRVYQGDYAIANMNSFVGHFEFSGISPAKEKDSCRELVIQFDYDVDGIIHVSAIDRLASRKEEGLTITESQIKLSTEDKQKAQEEISKLEAAPEASISKMLDQAKNLCEKLQKEGNKEIEKELREAIEKIEKATAAGSTDEDALARLSEIIYDYSE